MSTVSTPAVTTSDLVQVIGTEDGSVLVNAATLGFYGATAVAQHAAIADAAVDAASAIAQLNLLLAAMRSLGLIAT
jgi:hypothetical protein